VGLDFGFPIHPVEIGKSKNLPISNPVAKVQFSKSKNYATWKVLCQIGTNITILDNNVIFKFVNDWIIQDKIPSLQNYWIGW
jgi:hypothetical protein